MRSSRNPASYRWFYAWALTLCLACGESATQVEFWSGDRGELSASERREIEAIARAAVVELRGLLPAVPRPLTIRIKASRDVNPDTGETGEAAPPAMVQWSVDPRHPGGATAVARAWLRAAMFHELHHLVRDAKVRRATMLDVAVSEGLATAFERDFAGVRPAWGVYPANVATWVEELRDVADTSQRKQWLQRHSDGRRWIALRAGTYIADRASRASGQTPVQLVLAPTARILELASIGAMRAK